MTTQVDASLVLLAGSLTATASALILLNRNHIARWNAWSIRLLRPFYGRSLTERAAESSTPKQMATTGAVGLAMAAVFAVLFPTQLSRPLNEPILGAALVLGASEVIAAVVVLLLRRGSKHSEPTSRRSRKNDRQAWMNATVLLAIGAVTLATATWLALAR